MSIVVAHMCAYQQICVPIYKYRMMAKEYVCILIYHLILFLCNTKHRVLLGTRGSSVSTPPHILRVQVYILSHAASNTVVRKSNMGPYKHAFKCTR